MPPTTRTPNWVRSGEVVAHGPRFAPYARQIDAIRHPDGKQVAGGEVGGQREEDPRDGGSGDTG